MQRTEWFSGPSVSMVIDPLAKENLVFRSLMLRAITLPSIAGQSSKDFAWIILVEPDLDNEIRQELETAIAPYENMRLHTLSEEDDLSTHDFLSDHIPSDTTHLLTSHLDDDDALPSDFVEKMRSLSAAAIEASRMPFVHFGTQNVIQWDMDFNESVPYGTFSEEWHRAHHRAVSCGFSLIAEYPVVPLQIIASSHSRVHQYQDLSNQLANSDHNTIWMRDRVTKLLAEMKSDLSIKDMEFISYDDKISSVFMTNHGKNLQVNRVHEAKVAHYPVKRGQNFGEFTPDWALITEHHEVFTQVPDWSELNIYRVPPWRRPNNAPFPMNIFLYIKWHAQFFLLGKEKYYQAFYAMRFKQRPRQLDDQNTENL